MGIEFFQCLPDPSYAQGFARGPGEAANPELWDGLVGAWMPSLGPSGSTLMDISGRGNHGTLTNMDPATDWVPGPNGYALDFDGTNDFINIGVSSWGASIARGVTVSGRVRMTGALAQRGWFGGFLAGANTSLFVEFNANSANGTEEGGIRAYVGNGAGSTLAGGVNIDSGISDGGWHFLSVAFHSSSAIISVYLDGRLQPFVYSNTNTITSTIAFAQDNYIGALNVNGTAAEPFSGEIDSLSIHNRALSPSEILHLYEDPMALVRRRGVPFAVSGAAPAGHVGPLVNGPILKSKLRGLAA